MLLIPTMHVNAYGADATKGLVCNKPYSSLTYVGFAHALEFMTAHACASDYIVYFLTIMKRPSTTLCYRSDTMASLSAL